MSKESCNICSNESAEECNGKIGELSSGRIYDCSSKTLSGRGEMLEVERLKNSAGENVILSQEEYVKLLAGEPL